MTVRIAVINHSTVPLGLPGGKTVVDLLGALQAYVTSLIAPAWAVSATLELAPRFIPGAWALVLLDDADVANALGYHDLTADGLPLGKVFVKTTLAANEWPSVTAAHELVEMLVDPAINLLATGTKQARGIYAYEVADAVEEGPFILDRTTGIALSNFVWTTYFEDFHPARTQYDQLHVLKHPFSVAPGGYMSVLKGGHWTQVFGSLEKGERFAREDRRAHRSELRARRHSGLELRRSSAP